MGPGWVIAGAAPMTPQAQILAPLSVLGLCKARDRRSRSNGFTVVVTYKYISVKSRVSSFCPITGEARQSSLCLRESFSLFLSEGKNLNLSSSSRDSRFSGTNSAETTEMSEAAT